MVQLSYQKEAFALLETTEGMSNQRTLDTMFKYTQIPLALLDSAIEIPLNKGYSTIVDRNDYEWLIQWHWRVMLANTGLAYAICDTFKQKTSILIHRLIMEEVTGRLLARGEYVDHINNNSLDNRRINLRLSLPAENCRNRAKSRSNTSGFKGVSDRYKDGSWIAIITFNRKNIFLGRYKTVFEAAQAYDRAALWYHGDFAQLNFPNFNYGTPQEPNRTRQKGRTLKSNR